VDRWTGGPVDRAKRGSLGFDMRFAFEPEPDDVDLDRDFPLGDGTADVEGDVACPYCGEAIVIALDPGSGDRQDYVEDCQVCCQPWRVHVEYGPDGHATITATPADD
jgi:Cysteine-rich CPXCG